MNILPFTQSSISPTTQICVVSYQITNKLQIKMIRWKSTWCPARGNVEDFFLEDSQVSNNPHLTSFLFIFSPDLEQRPDKEPEPKVKKEIKSCTTFWGHGCVFPFIYKDVTYWSCTTNRRDGASSAWCPTIVTSSGQWTGSSKKPGWAACDPTRCILDGRPTGNNQGAAGISFKSTSLACCLGVYNIC